jgi:uncharacterized membrane protein YdfJ with MMPL/SSD domain
MPVRTLSTFRRSIAACAFAAATVLVSAALLTAAALVPAPAAAIPLIIVVCIGCPMAAAVELPDAIAVVRRERRHGRNARAHEVLRRQLDALPEREHPLGL